MNTWKFTPNLEPTIGVELELGLVDAETFKLKSAATELFKALPPEVADDYKLELMQSVVEITTGVCATVEDAREDLLSLIHI